jgi:hypothetical protein
MTTTTSAPTLTFTKIQTRNWRETTRYGVYLDGRRVGTVARSQDSSRTGGFWTARRIDGSVARTSDTRAAAASALVR